MALKDDQIRVLLVDDNATVLWGLGKLVESERPRMAVAGKAGCFRDALAQADAHPNITVLDLDMGGWSGLDILPELIKRSGGRVLIHTAVRDTRLFEDAFLLGARGIVLKGEPSESVIHAIEHIHDGGFWNSDVLIDHPQQRPPGFHSRTTLQERLATLNPAERQLIAVLATEWVNRYQSSYPDADNAILSLHELLSLYSKLGLRNRAELMIFAMQQGLTGAKVIHPTTH